MRMVFSISLLTFFLITIALVLSHYGIAQRLAVVAFSLMVWGVILYILELINE